jgi:hypothetical protein
VAQANNRVSRPEQVKKFVVVDEQWTIEGGELTPTLKLRRAGDGAPRGRTRSAVRVKGRQWRRSDAVGDASSGPSRDRHLPPAPDVTVRKPAVENDAPRHTLMIRPSAERALPS